jgi:hypothetical protein
MMERCTRIATSGKSTFFTRVLFPDKQSGRYGWRTPGKIPGRSDYNPGVVRTHKGKVNNMRLKSSHLSIAIILAEETNMKKYVSPTIHNYGDLSVLIQCCGRDLIDLAIRRRIRL